MKLMLQLKHVAARRAVDYCLMKTEVKQSSIAPISLSPTLDYKIGILTVALSN